MKLEAVKKVNCHYGSENLWKCVHCKDPPCLKACPVDAFYEVFKGVYSIDQEKCSGCGLCVDACPYGAIELVNGKAAKCDFCASFGFPLCVENGEARLVYTEEEIDRIGKAFGWFVFEDGEYIVEIPRPGLSEAWLFKELTERYEKLKGEYSFEEVLSGIEYEFGEIPERVKKRVLWWAGITFSSGGPLSFFDSMEIEEIAINGLKERVYVYIRGEGWKKTNIAIWTEEYFIHLVNSLASSINRRITLKNPRISAVLPDGSRLHAVIPPVAVSGHSLTIRRFFKRPFTPYDLIVRGTVSPEELALIWLAIEQEKNILIAGNTGSGKTTTLNAISAFIPFSERIIIVEEVPEIRIPHEHAVRLVPTEDVSMHQLVWDTLRMRPDRIFVGEVRKPEEVRALFDTMLAGQGKGSYATMHGRTCDELFRRILSMGIPEEDLCVLDLVVLQRRRSVHGKEERKIVELRWADSVPNILDMEEKELEKEIAKRAEFLKKLLERDIVKYCERVSKWLKSS